MPHIYATTRTVTSNKGLANSTLKYIYLLSTIITYITWPVIFITDKARLQVLFKRATAQQVLYTRQ